MLLLVTIFAMFMFAVECSQDCYLSDKTNHQLSSVDVDKIAELNDLINTRSNLKQIFKKINVIRPVGSYNHDYVRRFIRDYLLSLGWTVEETPFTVETLIGRVNFVNIVGTQNVRKSRRLILACHYDSLRKQDFVGAIDSALPCSVMLSIAEVLSPLLSQKTDVDVSLELVFFDGEEAFVKWSTTDSLYGSRYLASLWSNIIDRDQCSRLTSIDSLLLLDLLGASRPQIYAYKGGNYQLLKSLVTIERKLIEMDDIFKDLNHPYFNLYSISDSVIQDDHVPFMERGVPVLHLIPVPFPSQWHTTRDSAKRINWKSSKDIELILSVFLVQYFHLENQLSNLENIDQ